MLRCVMLRWVKRHRFYPKGPYICGVRSFFGESVFVKKFMVGAVGFLCCVFVSSGEAQEIQLPPRVSGFINDVTNEAVNASMIFATDDAVSNGHFVLRQQPQPDKKYDSFKLPGEYVFGERGQTWRPFVRGSFSHVKITSGVNPIDGIGEADFSVTELYAGTIGTGAQWRATENITLVPGFNLTYSHLSNNYDFNNLYSQTNFKPADGQIFNSDGDLFTYAPSLRMLYVRETCWGTVHYNLGYQHLFNDSISTDHPSLDVKSNTGLLTNRFDMELPLGMEIKQSQLSVRPVFQWTHINGEAIQGLHFVNMFEIGADLLADVADKGIWVSTLSLGGSYMFADDFEGYRVGLGARF
jgi:hypothetical protein